MKRFCVYMVVGILICSGKSIAQVESTPFQLFPIGSQSLNVSTSFTSNIIFPFPLKGVDKGTRDIIIQKAKGVENILQIKASKGPFSQTNLSVVTSDGKFYSFIVGYSAHPTDLNFLVGGVDSAHKPVVDLSDGGLNAKAISDARQAVLNAAPYLGKRSETERVDLELTGIYLTAGKLFFVLRFTNVSMVPFTASYIRFYVKDQHLAKRTAFQEQELTPVMEDSLPSVKGGEERIAIVAFDAFSIPEKKLLQIEAGDADGGRVVQLSINSKILLKAHVIK